MAGRFFVCGIIGLIMTLSAPVMGAEEGVLNYSEKDDATTLNPLNLSFGIDLRLADLLFNSLMTIDVFGIPQPMLLESMDPIAVSEDKRTITFKLREGILWHPFIVGKKTVPPREFTAEDVVFTYNILKDNRSQKTEDVSMFRSVETVEGDPYAVIFKTYRPMDHIQSHLFFRVIPKHALPEGTDYLISDGDEDFGAKIAPGTGPFYLGVRSLEKIRMKRNPKYFIEPPELFDTETQAPINEIVMHIDKDTNAASAQLLTEGRLLMPLVPVEKYTELRSNQTVQVLPYNPRSIIFLAYNLKHKFLQRAGVRLALTYATDRKRMLEQIYGTALAQEAKLNILSGPFPTGEGDPDIAPREYDPDKALELLKEAGFELDEGQLYSTKGGGKEPFVLDLSVFLSGEDIERICEFYINDLGKIGIKVTMNSVSRQRLKKDVLEDRNFDVALQYKLFGPNTDIVEALFSEAAIEKGGQNIAGYVNEEIEAILKENQTVAEERKEQNQRRLHAILHDDCPGTFLFSLQNYAAYRVDRLGGIEIHPFRFFTYINEWYYLKEPDLGPGYPEGSLW
jgi:peptide/nickel transport system substrate-binding protein